MDGQISFLKSSVWRDSSVTVESRLRAERLGFDSCGGSDGIFSPRHIVQNGSGAHQAPILWIGVALSPGGKAAGA